MDRPVPYAELIIERVWLCELTGIPPLAGSCITHGGDACIAAYDHHARK
jgi:hypothetical protein